MLVHQRVTTKNCDLANIRFYHQERLFSRQKSCDSANTKVIETTLYIIIYGDLPGGILEIINSKMGIENVCSYANEQNRLSHVIPSYFHWFNPAKLLNSYNPMVASFKSSYFQGFKPQWVQAFENPPWQHLGEFWCGWQLSDGRFRHPAVHATLSHLAGFATWRWTVRWIWLVGSVGRCSNSRC